MISRLIRALDAYIERDSLKSQLRACRVPFWPWDSTATLRRRLDLAMSYGWPGAGTPKLWEESLEGQLMRMELRLMRALGVK